MARRASLAVGLVVAALIGLLAFGAVAEDDDTPSALLGERVPEVKGETFGGESYDIDAARGRWVVVNFFATWCTGCIVEHPDLVALETWGAETDELEVVSVVFNDDPDAVEQFFADRGGSWPVLSDPGIAVDFQISQIPESFLVDPFGLVALHYVGGISADNVIEVIEGEQ